MSSYLDFEGVYDPTRNFAVTNWSDEDITSKWVGEKASDKGMVDGDTTEYTLRAGEVKTYPQYLAYHITRELVDREMYKIAAAAPSGSEERTRLEFAVANKDARKPFEDKTIEEVVPGKESAEVRALREQIKKELIASGELNQAMSSEMNLNTDGSVPEFADVPKKEEVVEVETKKTKK